MLLRDTRLLRHHHLLLGLLLRLLLLLIKRIDARLLRLHWLTMPRRLLLLLLLYLRLLPSEILLASERGRRTLHRRLLKHALHLLLLWNRR